MLVPRFLVGYCCSEMSSLWCLSSLPSLPGREPGLPALSPDPHKVLLDWAAVTFSLLKDENICKHLSTYTPEYVRGGGSGKKL